MVMTEYADQRAHDVAWQTAAEREATVISGEANTRMASVLALRSALKLEAKGMKRHGRSARTIAAEMLGMPGRPGVVKVYERLNAYIVERLGPDFSRPL